MITDVSKFSFCFSGENVVSEQEDEAEAGGPGSAPGLPFARPGHAAAASARSAPRPEWTVPRPVPAAATAPQRAPAG